MQYKIKVISNPTNLDDKAIGEMIVGAELRLNDAGVIRFHIEQDNTPTNVKEQVESSFTERCKELGLKWGSKTYLDEQAAYFVGAMVAMQAINIEYPPIWMIYIETGREIIPKY